MDFFKLNETLTRRCHDDPHVGAIHGLDMADAIPVRRKERWISEWAPKRYHDFILRQSRNPHRQASILAASQASKSTSNIYIQFTGRFIRPAMRRSPPVRLQISDGHWRAHRPSSLRYQY